MINKNQASNKKELNITLIKNRPLMFTNCTTVYLIVDSNGRVARQFTTIQSAEAALSIYGSEMRIVEAAQSNGTILATWE